MNGKAVDMVSLGKRYGVPYGHIKPEMSLNISSRIWNLDFRRHILVEVIHLGVVNMSLGRDYQGSGYK